MLDRGMTFSATQLAEAYLRQFRTGADDDAWAFDAVVERCSSLAEGIPLAIACVKAAATERELAYVAAGPVEDMLKWHGEEALEKFKVVADHNGAMRRALEGVWLDPGDSVYSSWLALAKDYGLNVSIPKGAAVKKGGSRRRKKNRKLPHRHR